MVKKVDKPWGYELIWAHTDKYVGKILHINAGHKLSLQYHEAKDETIFVKSGTLELHHDGFHFSLKEGESFHIKAGKVHRMSAGDHDVEVIEVSTPELDDVIRLSDAYGRVPECGAV